MNHPSVPRRFVLAIFGAVGVLGALSSFLLGRAAGQSINVGIALLHSLFVWGLYGLLSPIAIGAARRFPLDEKSWPRRLPVHLLALVAISLSHTIVYNAVMVVLAGGSIPTVITAIVRTAPTNFRSDVFVYALMIGGYYLYAYAVRHREREQALATAKLEALTSQLQPHFLFNTLNSISTLVLKGERDEAVRVVNRLADLLRITLTTSASQTVPLRDELELVERYLDIERVRFADRLRPRLVVPADAMPVHVPVLMLQTLVENAVRHGVAAAPDAGVIEVSAQRNNGSLCIEVSDDGPGPSPAGVEGVGLANTRERLRQLYGDRADFTLERGPLGGSIARVRIPL